MPTPRYPRTRGGNRRPNRFNLADPTTWEHWFPRLSERNRPEHATMQPYTSALFDLVAGKLFKDWQQVGQTVPCRLWQGRAMPYPGTTTLRKKRRESAAATLWNQLQTQLVIEKPEPKPMAISIGVPAPEEGVYGFVYLQRDDGTWKLTAVHRVMYSVFNSISLEDMKALKVYQSCGVTICCEPQHLVGAERNPEKDSSRRQIRRHIKSACPAGHVYAEGSYYTLPNGGRACKECWRIRNKRRYDDARLIEQWEGLGDKEEIRAD